MRKALCGIVIFFVPNVVTYFYCSKFVFLTVLTLSSAILLQFVCLCDFLSVLNDTKGYFNSKKTYKELRRMSNIRKFNLPDKDGASSFDSGLLSNYDSRLSTGKSKPNKFMSALRRFTKNDYNSSDENFVSRRPLTPSTPQARSPANVSIASPVISSPLSHSRRYNVNIDSINDESRIIGRRSLCTEYSPIASPILTRKRIPDGSNQGTPYFSSRISATANEMGIDQFPWVSPSVPIIPLVQSPLRNVSSPSQRFSSPLGDANSPRRNRVRIKLAGPNRSDTTLNDSSIESNSNTNDLSTTTKSVIKVLKEISRKRAYTPEQEDEEPPEAKRRPEHNLYMSRLEGEEENPLPNRSSKGEEDRKRCREIEWDTSNIEGPRRKRKLACIVNNEILSSLSSSIGLLQSSIAPVAKKLKRTANVGTQVSLVQDVAEKKQNEEREEMNLPKTFKETGTMPDPPQPTRPRSPVKEKVVTNLNGILKSALSKFNIKPNEESKKIEETSMNGFSAKVDNMTSLPAPVSGTLIPFSSSPVASSINPPSSLSLGIQSALTAPATACSFPMSTAIATSKSATTEASLNSTITGKNASSNPILGVNANQDPTEKKQEDTNNESKQEITNSNSNALAKTDSHFTSNTNKSVTSEVFAFKSSEIATSIIKGPTSTFTFGVLKTKEPTSVSSPSGLAEGTISSTAFISTSTSSSTTNSTNIAVSSAAAPTTTPQVVQNTSSIFSSSVSSPPKSEPFKFGTTGFGISNKTTDDTVQALGEKKETSSPFVFGKSDNTKTELVKQPFQFESKGFPFQQEENKNKELNINPTNLFGQNATAASAIPESTKPLFASPVVDTQKDIKPGGFSFKLKQDSQPKTMFSFGASASNQPVTTAPNTTTTSGTSIFSTPLSNSNVAVSTSATVVVTSAPASVALTSSGGPAISFGQPKLGLATLSSTSSTPTFGSVTSSFASGNNSLFGTNKTSTTTSSPIFGSTANNIQTGTTSLFGSATTSSAQPFGNSLGTNPSVTAFGSNVAGNTPQFGSTSTTASGTTFGSSITSTAPTFGSSSATTPSFGSMAPLSNAATGSNLFGGSLSLPSTTTPSFGTSTFGSVATTNASIFGNTTVSGTSAPAFGSSTGSQTAAPAFGSSTVSGTATPAFGSSTVSGTTTPAFGSSTASGTSVPVFGSSTLSGTTAPAFGSTIASGTTAPAFGSSIASGTAAPAFGTSTASGTTVSAFGSSAVSGTTTPTFGSSTVSGTATPAFGSSLGSGNSAPVCSRFSGSSGSAPAFGSVSSTPSFGSTSAAVPAFGSSQGFGNQQNTTFGTTPTFGQNAVPSTFGSGQSNTFGQTSTTPAFGSTSAFSASSTSFNATSNQTTPSFGATGTTFGASSTFGNHEANKPFGFNASATQPASTGGTFNFSAPQPQSNSGGIFQFGTSSSTPSNQPFQFSASQPNSSVGGSGQQMFSIGSGSTAPRRVTARRKK